MCMTAIVYGWSSFDFIFTHEQYFIITCNASSKEAVNNTMVVEHCQQYNLELMYIYQRQLLA